MTSVLVRIQHAEGRDAPLNRLLTSLNTPVAVVTDSGRPANPWRGFRKCLTDIPPAVSHVCVIQDDAVACRNLVPALHQIAEARPDDVVCLFLGGLPRRTAVRARDLHGKGHRFVEVHGADFVPVVATMWPTEVAQSFLQWCDDNPAKLGHRDPRSDDAVAGRWMRYTRHRVVCTIPSLVQHPDDVPSTIGKRASAGADRNRVALLWIGDDDPLDIQWA